MIWIGIRQDEVAAVVDSKNRRVKSWRSYTVVTKDPGIAAIAHPQHRVRAFGLQGIDAHIAGVAKFYLCDATSMLRIEHVDGQRLARASEKRR